MIVDPRLILSSDRLFIIRRRQSLFSEPQMTRFSTHTSLQLPTDHYHHLQYLIANLTETTLQKVIGKDLYIILSFLHHVQLYCPGNGMLPDKFWRVDIQNFYLFA